MARYNIYVTAKQGIFDPAGTQAAHALDNLGFEGINDVKIGKFIQLDLADSATEADVTKMCEKLLANPVIEDFRIEQAKSC
jgi:phosphoribosylformylglycinamidine synthase